MPDYNAILSQIRDMIADILGMTPDEVPVDAPFDRLGLASRDAVLLSGDLQDWLGTDLPPTLLYEHPTPAQLAAFLAEGASGARNDAREMRTRGSGRPLEDTGEGVKGTALPLDDFEEGRV